MRTLLGTLLALVLSLGVIGCCTYNCVREKFCKLHNRIDSCCAFEQSAADLSPPVVE
jgi:hypothetical protein